MDRLRALRRNALFDLVFTLAVALGLALAVQAYAVKPYKIPSPSMVPTLQVGQRVLVNRLGHRLNSMPSVGQVVVFRPPAGADNQDCGDRRSGAGTRRPCALANAQRDDSQYFIKRVVAVGGDTIAVVGGRVIRNGRRIRESYAQPCGDSDGCNFPQAIRVPKGRVFLMGDNRPVSDDSRFWGPVPNSWVVGDAFASYWPPKRVGVVR